MQAQGQAKDDSIDFAPALILHSGFLLQMSVHVPLQERKKPGVKNSVVLNIFPNLVGVLSSLFPSP